MPSPALAPAAAAVPPVPVPAAQTKTPWLHRRHRQAAEQGWPGQRRAVAVPQVLQLQLSQLMKFQEQGRPLAEKERMPERVVVWRCAAPLGQRLWAHVPPLPLALVLMEQQVEPLAAQLERAPLLPRPSPPVWLRQWPQAPLVVQLQPMPPMMPASPSGQQWGQGQAWTQRGLQRVPLNWVMQTTQAAVEAVLMQLLLEGRLLKSLQRPSEQLL